MFVFTFLACLLLAALIAYKNKCEITISLPVVTGGLILVLYLLAFFRALNAIDWLALALFTVMLIYLVRKKQLKSVLGRLMNTQSILIIIALILLAFSQKDMLANWWDDVNFWATDAKAMYYLKGFPGKYGNVAPEFGDYPPALSLFKYLFLHTSQTYKEGLAYSAYQVLNLILLLPLVSRLKADNKVINTIAQALSLVLLYLLPSVCNIICYQGSCADVTMGLLYGNLLMTLWDMYCGDNALATQKTGPEEGGQCAAASGKYFDLCRIAVFASVLVLTKNVGIEWVAYAFIFYLVFSYGKYASFKERLMSLVPWLISLAVELSWLLFCLINRRVAKLTSSGVALATGGNLDLSGYVREKIGYFVGGFAAEPMHTDHTGIINLSSLAFLLIALLVILLFAYRGIADKKSALKLLCFTIFNGLLAYGIIFLGHITIFASETQYSSSEVMAISISRYAAPFTLGTLLLLCHIFTRNGSIKRYALVGLFVLLTADLVPCYTAIFDYDDTVSEAQSTRSDMTSDAEDFIALVSEDESLWGQRILYLRDDHTVHWVHDTYVNAAVAPVAVVYGGLAADTQTAQSIAQTIEQSHAAYVYADKIDGDMSGLFEGLCEDGFECGVLYKYEDGKLIRNCDIMY